jgi:hypothetical protein
MKLALAVAALSLGLIGSPGCGGRTRFAPDGGPGGNVATGDTLADGESDAPSATAPDIEGDAGSPGADATGDSAEGASGACADGDSGCGAFVSDAGLLGDGRAPYHALAVTAGMDHTCVLLDDHKVKCWGENSFGQLGLGDTMPRGANAGELGDSLPTVDLGTGHSAVAIAAGFTATCAILENGQVKCWGQLGGTGGGPTPGSMPGQMGDDLPALDLGGHRALAVAPGERGATILVDDGSVWGWYVTRPVGPLDGVPPNRRAVAITPEAQFPPAPVLLDDGTIVGVGEAAGPDPPGPVDLLSPGETARGLFRSQNLPGLCATWSGAASVATPPSLATRQSPTTRPKALLRAPTLRPSRWANSANSFVP